MTAPALPVPPHFDSGRMREIRKVAYADRLNEAGAWAAKHRLRPAAEDATRVALVAVDMQNTFCHPDFEMYVGGASGTAALDDTRRLCEFIYRNLHRISSIHPTLDTHSPMQVFHSLFWVGAEGEHPDPLTTITAEDVESGKWRFNEKLAPALGISPEQGHRNVRHYVRSLQKKSRFDLTVWPYHGILGGIGHALSAPLEEAVFFHAVARASRTDFQTKGDHPFTEHYSVFGPEVDTDTDGHTLVGQNEEFLDRILGADAIVIAGEAKSHCVAWTVEDLLEEIRERDESLARKVYLLEDCTSPVVIPGAADFTREGEAAFERFREAGMHLVCSTDPMDDWPGMKTA